MACVDVSALNLRPEVSVSDIGASFLAGKKGDPQVLVSIVEDGLGPGKHPRVDVRMLGQGFVAVAQKAASVNLASEPASVGVKSFPASVGLTRRQVSAGVSKARQASVSVGMVNQTSATAEKRTPEVELGLICPVYYGMNVLFDDLSRALFDDGSSIKY